MPEKIADKVEANGHAMPAIAPEKIEETTRRYMREAGTTIEDAFRRSNDLMATTTEFYFDMIDRTMHNTIEMTNRGERAMQDMMTIYRRTYTENFKFWETYWQDLNKIFARPR